MEPEPEITPSKDTLLALVFTVTPESVLPVGALSQSANVATGFDKDVDAQIARHYASVEGLYKDIHANPELAFDTVCRTLSDNGIKPQADMRVDLAWRDHLGGYYEIG